MDPLAILLVIILGAAAFVLATDAVFLLLRWVFIRYELPDAETFTPAFLPLDLYRRAGSGVTSLFTRKPRPRDTHHRELMKVLLGLDEEKLEELLRLYEQEFGESAARYARRTYRKWERGEVRPIRQTFERFMVHLPDVMDFDLKCEVLRHLMEAYSARDDYDLTVYTDDWEETLEPLVRKLIDKPYNAALPKQIEDRLQWLAHDDMQAAEQILKRSQVEEGRIAVSMLREEFGNIERLLAETKGRRRVRHKLKFPYGTINLEIRQR